ncbi:MAG: TolB-like 6-bladed beta-propeller domain-containing protein [Bacteroidales bacterium]|jgi:hypothetical protein|nr:TolB-like 6-bladed beta-propeller domain-containing protein [Bacteroidales bacterium]MCI1785605.1 TolB-like 6-bladed beta-propeller domain-containing protein [Bacteroidales bacterium]
MRKLFSILCILFSVVFVVSCHNGGELNNSRKKVTATLSGKVLQVKDFPAGNLFGTIDGYLLFQVYRRDTGRVVIYKIDGDSLKYAAGIINKGRGPHEFIYVEFSISKDTLYVSNSSPSGGILDIWGIPLDDISNIKDYSRWKDYKWSGQDIMNGLSFVKIKDSEFLISGAVNNTRHFLSKIDFSTNKLHQFDLWPKDSTAAPVSLKQFEYTQSKLFTNNGKLLYACLEGRYMFISKIGDNTLGQPVEIYSHLPDYKLGHDGQNLKHNEDCEYGIYPYTTSRFIYAQLSRSRKEINASADYKGYPPYYFDEIEVYDWNGKFIGNFKTDRPFFTFAVSPDDSFIYTLSMDLQTKERAIMRYQLPKL